MLAERRINRSKDETKALELQLAASLKRANFRSVILAEDQGFTVAGVGKVVEDEDVAALAPSLAPGNSIWRGSILSSGGAPKKVIIAPVETLAGNLYLCGVGGDASKTNFELLCSSLGVQRILV